MLKGCESVKEEGRFVEEEEEEVVVVKMMTNVGIYEFNAKDLIGHGAFAVVYKGRLKSVSCATLFPVLDISCVLCIFLSTLHNVQFVKHDVTVSFMAQVLDTVTYLVPQVLDTAS